MLGQLSSLRSGQPLRHPPGGCNRARLLRPVSFSERDRLVDVQVAFQNVRRIQRVETWHAGDDRWKLGAVVDRGQRCDVLGSSNLEIEDVVT